MAEPRLDTRIAKEFTVDSAFNNHYLIFLNGRRGIKEDPLIPLRSFVIQYVGRWKGTDAEKTARSQELLSFWKCMRGNSRCFRFKDWSDYQDNGKGRVALVEGVYRLVKDYQEEGEDNPFTINIYKPVAGTIAFAGGAAGGTLDYSTGIVTGISSPGTWTGEYDLWAHFTEEETGPISYSPGGIMNWTGLKVMEARVD